MSGAGNLHQHREELLDSVSVHQLPWDEVSDVSFEGFPGPQTCPEVVISRTRIRILSVASSDFLASVPGGHVVHVPPRSGLSASHEVPSASLERCESVSGGHRRGFLGRFLPLGSSVVVRRVQSSDTSWGASLEDSHLSGFWPPGCSHYSISHWELLVVLYAVQGFLPDFRQHHGPVLSEESRGNAFFDSQCGRAGHSEALREQPSSSSSAVHSGPPECSCGISQSSITGFGLRVDPLLSGVSGGPSSLAGDDRSLCDGSESQASSLFLADVRP